VLVAIYLPVMGFSPDGRPGGSFCDGRADQAFVRSLRKTLRSDIELHIMATHINDSRMMRSMAARLALFMQGQAKSL
jgi:uncharacterized protein (UPF0261 family)